MTFRERRPWTDDEDELLRAAVQRGDAIPFYLSQLTLRSYVDASQKIHIAMLRPSGMRSQSMFRIEPTRIVASDGMQRWPQL